MRENIIENGKNYKPAKRTILALSLLKKNTLEKKGKPVGPPW